MPIAYELVEHAGAAPDTTLNGALTSVATSFVATSGTSYPTGSVGPFYIVIDPGLAAEEKIQCSARATNTFTVATSGRGVDGTSAVAHNSGAVVRHVFTAIEANEANTAAAQTVGKVTTAGDLLYATAAATLARLGIGAANRVLRTSGTAPAWGQIVAADITASTITATELAADAVTTAKILDANVTAAKLAAPLSNPPRCYLTNSAPQVLTTGVEVILTFNTEMYDTDTMHDLTTNPGHITIKTAGTYVFHAQIELTTGSGLYAIIYKNNTTSVALNRSSMAGAANSEWSVTTPPLVCAVNDFFNVRAAHNAGADRNTVSGSRGPFFSALWVAP